MGGDRNSPFLTYTHDSEESPSLGQDFSVRSPASNVLSGDPVGDGVENSESGVEFEGSEVIGMSEANRKRARNIYMKVWRSYGELQGRSRKYAKRKILGYTPGSWTEGVGGTNLRDYKVPKTTTILLVGTKGSGKSSLVNKISDVFASKKFTSQRAQVSFNPSIGGGTCFAQEYMIPKCAKAFCLYDTPSLSDDQSENENMLKHWMTNGIRHGEPIMRASDDVGFKTRMECNAQNGYSPIEARPINFVVFVVNALSVLQSMEGEDETMKHYTQVVSKAFNSPFLSFKDDKPVVVVTHGDLLSLSDRVRVRIHLGELLGIHPKTQIFDIPESDDSGTKVAILDMLHYCLEHADKNLPFKDGFSSQTKVSHPPSSISLLMTAMLLSFVFGVFYRNHILHAPRTSSAPGADCIPCTAHTFSIPEAHNFQHAAKDCSSAPEEHNFQHAAKDSCSAPEAHKFQHDAKDSSSAPEAHNFQHAAKDSCSAPEAHKFQHDAKDSSSAPEAHNFQHAAKDSCSAPEAHKFQHDAKDSSSAPEAHKFQHDAKDSSSAPEAHNFQHAAKDSCSAPEAHKFQHDAKDSSSAPEADNFQHTAKDSCSAPEAHKFQHDAKDSSSAPEAHNFQHAAKDSCSAPEAHKFQHDAKDSSSAPDAHNFQHAAKDSSPSSMPDAQHRYHADRDSSTKSYPRIEWSKIRQSYPQIDWSKIRQSYPRIEWSKIRQSYPQMDWSKIRHLWHDD